MQGNIGPGISLAEIVALFGGQVVGDDTVRVRQVAALEDAATDTITFLTNPRLLRDLSSCGAGALIVGERHLDKVSAVFKGNLVVVGDAHVYFAWIARHLNPPMTPAPGIHPGAVVESEIPASVSVGPGAWVGTGVALGEDVIIGANCSVADNVTIGDGSRLYPGVSVYHGCVIGKRTSIHSNTVIGSDGFGFAREKDGSWVKIPQIGRVVIGDDVDIGASTAIDRGAIGDTVIGDNAIIDNQVHIAHNCRIGRKTAIAGATGMAGSTKIGERCMLAGAAMINGHLNICDDVVVSGGTLVMKSIHTPGVYTSAAPAQEHAAWMKNFSHLRHLDQMAKKIHDLENRLAELEGSKETKS